MMMKMQIIITTILVIFDDDDDDKRLWANLSWFDSQNSSAYFPEKEKKKKT